MSEQKHINQDSIKHSFKFNVKKSLFVIKDHLFQTKEEETKWALLSVLKKRIFDLPISVRVVSSSLFLFILGRGLWWDPFFSVYVKSIVDNVFTLSLIWMLLPLSKLLFSIPIWELNNTSNKKYIIFVSKVIYILSGIFYFLAWVTKNVQLLIFAVILNGIASSILFITYESHIRDNINKKNSQDSWWFYFSSYNLAFVIWAVIASFLVMFIPLPFLFLFIVVFGTLSLFTDHKIPIKTKQDVKTIFAKDGFLVQLFKKSFSIKPIKDIIVFLKNSPQRYIYTLGYEWLFGILDYIWFLFIPLVAMQNDFSLSQIALIFALMKLPHVTNFFIVSFSSKFNKKLFVAVVLVFLSFLYAILGFNVSFGAILVISFGIALALSLIRPIISALITEDAHITDTGMLTGVQQFISQFAKMAGSLGFGMVVSLIWMHSGFFLVGLSLFVLSVWWLSKRYIKRNKELFKTSFFH